MRNYDVAIIGGGPAGSTCAALCAQAGRRVLLLERAVFPREKVCGDCLNPASWPILDQLGVSARVLAAVRRLAAVAARRFKAPWEALRAQWPPEEAAWPLAA